jgi:cell division protein FtsB
MEPDEDRGPDPDYPVVERRKPMVKRPDWVAVGVAVLSILTTLGAWTWWGGRLAQRVDTIEADRKEDRRELAEIRRENAKQDIALSVTGQQYTEVIRRLDGIDRKLDKR